MVGSDTVRGMETPVFLCPHCETQLSAAYGPNITILGEAPNGIAVMYSCPKCQKALSSYFEPAPR